MTDREQKWRDAQDIINVDYLVLLAELKQAEHRDGFAELAELEAQLADELELERYGDDEVRA